VLAFNPATRAARAQHLEISTCTIKTARYRRLSHHITRSTAHDKHHAQHPSPSPSKNTAIPTYPLTSSPFSFVLLCHSLSIPSLYNTCLPLPFPPPFQTPNSASPPPKSISYANTKPMLSAAGQAGQAAPMPAAPPPRVAEARQGVARVAVGVQVRRAQEVVSLAGVGVVREG
jgi:hypothetical protein